MKTIILILVFVSSFAQDPIIEWQKSYGGSGEDFTYSMVETSDGGLIMAGGTNANGGDVSGLHGGRDFWVVKTNSVGNIEWQRALGGSFQESANSIIQTSDGGYIVTGYSSSDDGDVIGWHHGGASISYDIWVVKLSSSGIIEWQRSYGGGGNESAQKILQTTDGGYIIAGRSNQNGGEVSGNHGTDDCWILKITNLGVIQWQKSLGGTGSEYAVDIISSNDGGYVVAGVSTYNNGDVSGNHGSSDFWIIKINNVGTIQWQKSLGGTNSEDVESIIKTADGGYLVLGESKSDNHDVFTNYGGTDLWLVKISSVGAIQWQKVYGGTLDDFGKSIKPTADGGYIISGESKSSNVHLSNNKGLSDCWIIKLEITGHILWQKTFGGSLDDYNSTVVPTNDGKYILAGNSKSNNLDVSGNHGQLDIWIAKLAIVPFSISPVSTKAICQSTVTLTAAGCNGAVKWYLDANGNGTNLTYLATANTLYYTVSNLVYKQYIRATCTVGTLVSPLSNLATIQAGPDISPLSYLVSPNVPINIFASGCPIGSTYLWSSGETTQTISKSATSYAIYSVKCVSPTCQSAEASSYLSVGNVIANNDSYSLNVDTPFSGNFASNDASLSPKTIYVDYLPSYGTVTWDNTGAFVYTPIAGYTGHDSFKYYLTNGAGSFSNYATVSLNILCPNTVTLSSTNSPSNDFNAGTHNRRASSSSGNITATNKITGTTIVNYFARNIVLGPGFKAENGVVFRAQTGGCN